MKECSRKREGHGDGDGDGQVCGNTYFITNSEPRRLWEFINTFLKKCGCIGATDTVSYTVAMALAMSMGTLKSVMPSWIWPSNTAITKANVIVMAKHSWYDL